jgi:hypothetical protein
MDNDTLNFVDQLKRAIVAILQRLHRPAQPRSRIAVAAETRAAWVASLDFMTPTSALMAVLVWPRASERISVMVLDISRVRE